MDYKLKYYKYKQKYITLKNNKLMIGGKINSSGIGIKYTIDDYNKQSKKEQDKFPFYCKNDNPYLCSFESPSYGLCKPKITDCIKYKGENTLPEYDLSDINRSKMIDYGKTFGYNLYGDIKNTSNNSGLSIKNCSKIIENSTGVFKGKFIVPNIFKIMTYNCWWSIKETGDSIKDIFHRKFFEIRMNEIAKIINESDGDIICLQEVGKLTFDILQPLLHDIYPYYYETPFNIDIEINMSKRGRTLESVCFCKFPAKGFKLFSVQGNLNYNNSMLMLEFDNLVVFNVYLQAGSRNSPGQKDLWYNYSRCRYPLAVYRSISTYTI